jgi:hypothetical protein
VLGAAADGSAVLDAGAGAAELGALVVAEVCSVLLQRLPCTVKFSIISLSRHKLRGRKI